MQEPQISEERQLDWIAKIEAILLYSNVIDNTCEEIEFENPRLSIYQYFYKEDGEILVQIIISERNGRYVNFCYRVDLNRRILYKSAPEENIPYADQFEEALNFHFDAVTKLLTLKETAVSGAKAASEILFID